MPADDHGSDDAATGERDDAPSDDERGEYVGEYDKLVRDDVPAVVRADGNRPVTRRVDGHEYDRYLAAKLQEEVDEVLDATGVGEPDASRNESEDAVLSELADVYAVVAAMAAARGHSMAAVRDRAREKANARGGFADGVVLERIDPPASGDDNDAGEA